MTAARRIAAALRTPGPVDTLRPSARPAWWPDSEPTPIYDQLITELGDPHTVDERITEEVPV